jgi:hypothetical protein
MAGTLPVLFIPIISYLLHRERSGVREHQTKIFTKLKNVGGTEQDDLLGIIEYK